MFNKDDLNDLYFPLCEKAEHIKARLSGDGVCAEIGWYNNHAHKSSDGFFEADCYPIPIVEAKGLFDVEIDFSGISVTSKLSKQSALDFDYGLLDGFSFEAYGADDYLSDFYHPERGISDMLRNIKASFESEVFFSFDIGEGKELKLFKLLDILCENEFYY